MINLLAEILPGMSATPEQKARLNAALDYDPYEERDIERLKAHINVYFGVIRATLEAYLEAAFPPAEKSAFALPRIPGKALLAIQAVLADQALRGIMDVLFQFAETETGTGQAIASAWATMHAAELVREIDNTTQAAINAAISDFPMTPGMTIGDIIQRVPLGEDRALTIATTEVTRAYAIGQQRAAENIYKLRPRAKLVKVWFTRHDDRVCAVCGPLNRKKVNADAIWAVDGKELTDAFAAPLTAPPAHPRCRCRMHIRAALPGEE